MKTAIITGASQGLGKAIAIKLAQNDYEIILIARRERFLKEVQSAIEQHNGKSTYYCCDISDNKEVSKTIEKISSAYRRIDLLVNCAGAWTDDDLQKNNPQRRELAIKTNLLGHIFLTEAVLPLLNTRKVSRVFTVISTAGVEGIPAGNNTNWKTYGASKWGLKGYTNALRESLRNTSIQVIQFFPGGFESNLYENAERKDSHKQPWMMKTEDVVDIAVFAITRPDDVYMEQIVVSKYIGN